MTMIRKVLTLAAISAPAIGCGESGPKLVPVSGTVTLNGKPLEGAVITFYPDQSLKDARPGEDVTGPAGNYKAMTLGRSGVAAGKYKVVVSKSTADPSGTAETFRGDAFMAGLATDAPGPKKPKKDKSKIEGEFSRDVPPEGAVLDFDVKADVK